MSTVDQIHHLEARVDRLLVMLRNLRTDNDSLRGDLAASEERGADLERRLAASDSARQDADRRGDELEQRLSHLHAEHEEIEATITRTLDQLGKLEIGSVAGEDAQDAGDGGDDAPAAEAAGAEAATGNEAETGDVDDAHAAGVEAARLPDDDEERPIAGEPEAAEPEAAEPEAKTDNGEGDDLDIF